MNNSDSKDSFQMLNSNLGNITGTGTPSGTQSNVGNNSDSTQVAANDDFALTPATVSNMLINYKTSQGIKIYEGATKELGEVKFDCKTY